MKSRIFDRLQKKLSDTHFVWIESNRIRENRTPDN